MPEPQSGTTLWPPVPWAVRIAVASVLLGSLGPCFLTYVHLLELSYGEISDRPVRFSDWLPMLQPLALTVVFWLIALGIHQRFRVARIALIVLAAFIVILALFIVADRFEPMFLLAVVACAGCLLEALLMPGLAAWCSR